MSIYEDILSIIESSQSSIPWDVSTATYANKFVSVNGQETSPRGLAFSSDGLAMYIIGTANDTVYQYTLSIVWDVSTATYANKSVSVNSQETSPNGLAFSSDGLAMYIVGSINDTVYQYTLSIAWDVSTATYASKSVSVNSQETSPNGLAFSSDGLAMYVVGQVHYKIYQYTLSTAWDVSTASYASKSVSVISQDTAPYSPSFSSDGLAMYIVGDSHNTIYQYTI
jgi:sugar lactone lactonase YvrE